MNTNRKIMRRDTTKKSTLLKKTIFSSCTLMLIAFIFPLNGHGQDLVQNNSDADHYVPLTWFAEDSDESVYKQKINIALHGVSFDQAVETIADLGDIRLSYDNRHLPSGNITLMLRDVTVIEAFQTLFEGSGMEALASPRGQVVIRKDIDIQPDTGTLQGQIVEAGTDEPLVGATVYIEELERGASTDVDGEYTLESLATGEYTLRVTYIGYRQYTTTTSIGSGTNNLDFTLRADLFGMDEIVVTGVVGDTESKRLPFTVGRVTSRDLEMVPGTNAASAIRGKIPGVNMVQSSGLPGSDVSVILRGATSIMGSNSPMYIVDGVILGSSPTDVESLDIANIEVIKGAAASSLYGSRAANGVINITTQRGANLAEGFPRITVRNEYGVNQLPRTPETNSSHAYDLSGNPELPWIDSEGNPTAEQVGRSTGPGGTTFMDREYPVQTYDHLDRFFEAGSYYSNYISVAQRVGQVNYMASFNNSQNSGIMKDSEGYGRQNVRLNMDSRLLNNLTVSASGYFSTASMDEIPTSGENSPFYGLLIHAPDIDLAEINSETGRYYHHPDMLLTYNNPLYDVTYIDNITNRNRFMGSSDIRYQPLEWMELSGNISYDRSDVQTEHYVPIWYRQARDRWNGGRLNINENQNEAINTSLTATVNREFGGFATRTQFRVLQESADIASHSLTGEDFQVADVRTINATNTDRQSMSSSSSQIRAQGYYLISNIDYQGKYILDVVGRRDGSSLFGADERWHNYYRASAAYRISEEDWYNVPVMDEFKIRASRGTAGGRPSFSAQYETWSVTGSTVTKNTLGNRNLKPEFATETEFGLELGFLERILFDVTYANTVTEDQIIQLPLVSYFGFNNQWVNGGTIDSNTLELSLRAFAVQKRDMSLSFTMLYDRTRSTITDFNRPDQLTSSMFYLREGEEIGTMYGPRWITSNSDVETTYGGDYSEYFDKNDEGYLVPVGLGNSWRSEMWGSGDVVADDGTVLGTWGYKQTYLDEDGDEFVDLGRAMPDFNMSFGTNFRYKSFSFSALLEGQFGGQIYNDTRQRRVRQNLDIINDQSGKPDNEKKPINYYQNRISDIHNQFVEDATYIKLREVALRYRFDHAALAPFFGDVVNSVSFSLIGRNLLTWTDYMGIDPEVGDIVTRRDNFIFPNFRTISGSLEVQF